MAQLQADPTSDAPSLVTKGEIEFFQRMVCSMYKLTPKEQSLWMLEDIPEDLSPSVLEANEPLRKVYTVTKKAEFDDDGKRQTYPDSTSWESAVGRNEWNVRKWTDAVTWGLKEGHLPNFFGTHDRDKTGDTIVRLFKEGTFNLPSALRP